MSSESILMLYSLGHEPHAKATCELRPWLQRQQMKEVA